MTRFKLLRGDALQGDFHLHGHQLGGDALLALLEGLAHAEDDASALRPRRRVDASLTVSSVSPKYGAALAVADDDVLHAHAP